jgi:hypothetical protein
VSISSNNGGYLSSNNPSDTEGENRNGKYSKKKNERNWDEKSDNSDMSSASER